MNSPIYNECESNLPVYHVESTRPFISSPLPYVVMDPINLRDFA